MRSLLRSLLMFLFGLSLFSCGRQVHPLSGQNLTVAQVPLKEAQVNTPVERKAQGVEIKISTRDDHRTQTRLIKRATKPAKHIAEKIAAKQQKISHTFQEGLTAAKQVKKVQEIRLVDILFFVIVGILVAVTLALLHQVGVSTDMAIFIAMGAALVIVVVYIYLHTYIFTA